MAFVLSDKAFSMAEAFTLNVSSSTSTKTGINPF